MKAPVTKSLVAAIAVTPLMASAVQLEDYLVANSSYDEAFVSGSVTGIEPAGTNPNDQFGYTYSLDADYEKAFNTLPRSWSYRVGLNASGNRPSQETVAVTDENDVTTIVPTESTNDLQLSFEGIIDTYFHESRFPQAFWFGRGVFTRQDSLPDDAISASIGLGYGRVYNATPLAKVIRIVEELNEEGLLTGPIPDSIALETAEIVDRQEEFESKFGEDDYKPDYYAAIEAALSRSGALLDDKFGALGALTIDKVLVDEPISARRHGWVVRLGAGLQSSDLSGLTDNDPKLLAQFEYAKPFGYRGQFINVFSFEPIFSDETITSITNDMSYTYEVSDMIDWVNTWNVTFSDGDVRTTSQVLTSTYNFDLGNSLDYSVGIRLVQTDVDPNPMNSFGDSPEISFESGFKYRLK